jgi:hypothetical protein
LSVGALDLLVVGVCVDLLEVKELACLLISVPIYCSSHGGTQGLAREVGGGNDLTPMSSSLVRDHFSFSAPRFLSRDQFRPILCSPPPDLKSLPSTLMFAVVACVRWGG